MTMTNRERRQKLIETIEESRESHVVAYITGDRQGAPGQIGGDVVRPMYNHVRGLGFAKVPRIDLFLYSQGGVVDVPWRLVTMLRECCEELNVLVPYKAYSAATLVALGADHIVMGKKGELGPIDPIVTTRVEQGGQTAVQAQMSVEDVMAFVAFLKEQAGLSDQDVLSGSVNILTEKLTPWVLGSIYRTHSHIRLIAQKLLASHQLSLKEQQINAIVESLAEKMYFHGHAIGREEAAEIGLPIEKPSEELDTQMWQMYEAYETLLQLNQPVDPEAAIPPGQDEHKESVIIACVESKARLDVYRGNLKLWHVRKLPPKLNLNINLTLGLPPGQDPQQLSQDTQQTIQNMLQQLQGKIASMVEAEIRKQSPIQETKGRLVNGRWQEATNEGI